MPRSIAELMGQQSPTPIVKEFQPSTGRVRTVEELMGGTPSPDMPQPSLLSDVGRRVEELGGSAATAAMKVLDVIGRPQAAAFGQILEGPEGFKAGLSGKKKYSGKDILEQKFGIQNDPYYAKTIAGLGIDLVADPLNVVGLGPVRRMIGGATQAVGLAEKARLAGQLPGIKQVVGAVRPLHELDSVEGLRDFARLKESGSRAIVEHANEDVLKTLSPKFKGWKSQLPETKRLKAMAYAVDEDKIATLPAEEQKLALQFKNKMDEQWTKEVQAGQQQPVKKLINYVPYITKPDIQRNVSVAQDVSGVSRHSKKRTLPDLATAVGQKGAEDNLAEILRRRLISGNMAIHHADTVVSAGVKFGSDVPKGADWRKLDFSSGMKKVRMPDQALLTGMHGTQLKDVYFPKPVADYLEKAHVLWNQTDELENVWKSAVVGWKSWVVLTPQQHLTNFMGNAYNAYVHGDLTLPEMAKMLPQMMRITNGKIPMPSLGGYTSRQVEELARKYEVVGTAGRYENISNAGKTYNYNPLSGSNIASKWSLHAGQHFIEEPFRLAVFLKNLKNGKSPEEAALAVKDVFFDYAELTPQLKFARDYGLAPFVTWMSKNIPLQVSSTVKNPQRLARVESTIAAGQEALGGTETVIPKEDTREGLLGTGEDRATRVPLPLHDLNRLPVGDYNLNDTRNDWLGGMAAPLKMPLELMMGQKMYGPENEYLRKIDRSGQGDPVKPFDLVSKLAAMLPPQLSQFAGINEEGLQNPYMSYLLGNNPLQYYNKLLQMADPDNPLSGTEQALGLSGMRSKELNPDAQVREMERRMQKLILEP